MNEQPPDSMVRTPEFAHRIIRLYSSLPRDTVTQVLRTQLLRSGTSIGANHREANRDRSKTEFISKFGDRLKEAEETDDGLELIDGERL